MTDGGFLLSTLSALGGKQREEL
ncbi:MAG: hypothetical protein JWM13_1026, partial [Arthrobacter sp.]|nr:hypothetical protein [Arthrobacter sp.]